MKTIQCAWVKAPDGSEAAVYDGWELRLRPLSGERWKIEACALGRPSYGRWVKVAGDRTYAQSRALQLAQWGW